MLVNEMIVFYYVVQLKSFSQAALQLKVSKSYISKHITQLEQDLSVRLLNRNTRQLSLTEEGEVFYQHCQTLFEHAQSGYEAVADSRNQPSGTLKISVPPAFAFHVLGTSLAEFSTAYPDVKLNITLDSRVEDIIEQGYDLVLRSSILPDSNLVATKLLSINNTLCVSPLYLKNYGKIQRPEQLSSHRLAMYSSKKLTHELTFTKGGKKSNIIIEPYLQSNSLDFIMQMVISGNCIAILPDFMTKVALMQQQLLVCLPEYRIPESPFYVLYPNRKFTSLRVKLFIELLKTYLATH